MKNVSDSKGEDIDTIGWCGWYTTVPAVWEPLKIDGGWTRGSMMLGTQGNPVLMLKWWRPRQNLFDADGWIRQRFEKLGVRPHDDAPLPDGFSAVAWINDFHYKEDAAKSIWYGYADGAGLMMECITTSLVERNERGLIFNRVIPSMRVSRIDEDVQWSLFSARFMSPAGFRLFRRHLYLGDIGLELRNDAGCRLLLRQVYPAKLALKRRGLSGWINTPLFKERRFLRRPETKEINGGMVQYGWKRMPVPVGWLRPLYSYAVGIVDQSRDRLLLAEMQSPAIHDGRTALAASRAMCMKEGNNVW